ncbi:ABC transporter permease [Persicitalea jodogahamensis]|uniref:ABC transporter permease n=1 Tax=Persicitalea jodogahamensis TaxID=402147 RepID=A0A8J3GA19_9BACT|nr:ABC transporter permease [Persicitalea jodogahamensis]GHB80065.1 ABC transporter permease [Persicitalea jodogahamensis]
MISNYLKLTWKVLLRHPFYTFITLFGITLTLTVLMVLTSFLDHLLGTHYPETKRDRSLYITRLVQKDTTHQGRNMGPMSFAFLKDYVKSLKTPENVGIATIFGFANTYVNGKRIKLNTKYTDADFWRVTEFDFVDGKPYTERNIDNGDHVAVITDDLRRQYFEDDEASVVGKFIDIESIKYRVIGVVKGSPVTRPYTYGDVYFPYTAPKSNYQDKGFRGRYLAIVLAKDKRDFPAIRTEYASNVGKIPLPQTDGGFTFHEMTTEANPYLEDFASVFLDGSRTTIVYSIIGFLMLMLMGLPAINLVNVNVSRIMERASEIGVRKAFGAPAKALLWQFIIENIFITLIGGMFALSLSFLIIQLINNSGWIPYADLTINFSVFAASIAVCLVFGLLSGVLPAYRMSKLKIVDALKS